MQSSERAGNRRAFFFALAIIFDAGQVIGETPGAAVEYGSIDTALSTSAPLRIVVLPFRLHSASSLGFLTGALDALLAERIEAGGEVSAVVWRDLPEHSEIDIAGADRSDTAMRRLAGRTGLDAVVSGSLTELAGRFSLDVRVTPADPGAASTSLVLAVASDRELLDRLGELADRVIATVRGGTPDRIVELRIEGAGSLEAELVAKLSLQRGAIFDAAKVEADRRAISVDPRIANVTTRSLPVEGGVTLVYKVLLAERILGGEVRVGPEIRVAEVLIRGNKRVEEDAIRARIRTAQGTIYDLGQVARDVRLIFEQGFFRDIQVLIEETPAGRRVIFEVEESPIVREIALSGNENLDSDKIKEALTLTTGAPLDYPLLRENAERVKALYRSEGYYLATVGFEIEEMTPGSIAINFNVEEREKLKLREIDFVGNEAYSDRELREGFSTKTWKFYSWATSWIDRTGTYSAPIFLSDLRRIEKLYTDNGFVEVRLNEPEVVANEQGLFLKVQIDEGPQFSVGELTVEGDETLDLVVLREKIRLEEGETFNRSDLTADADTLAAHYTDRGFFFATVSPITQTDQDALTVDVRFVVEKGPLYFVRNVEVHGNTRTVDFVIRREIRLVEGQLYSARALRVSNIRIRRLGFFEDVSFEPNTTEDPSQLDLDVTVVERPTGALSFGAGFSSADSFIFTASLSQSNLFGRGYGANLSAQIGGNSNRFFISLTDPYFLGSSFSFSTTAFLTQLRFDDFEQDQRGVELSLSHPLTIDNRASITLRYGFSSREVEQDDNVNALAAPISRQILQGSETTSRLGLTLGIDKRNDRFQPTAGYVVSGGIEYAGLGGFTRFLSLEGRAGYFLGAPDWLFERSTFVISTRLGYKLPFNDTSDFDLVAQSSTICANPSNCINSGDLDQIDDDVKLPLTERFFLGGLGGTRLRGFEGRSVGPRRAELRFTNLSSGRVFHPVGTRLISNPATGQLATLCDDTPTSFNFGNGNGRCNSIQDRNHDDFDDINETQVIGGSSYISSTFEYRFPISAEIGLMGFGFIDAGNAFIEGDVLFDVMDWRYGYGGGVLWFSPFGPLQLVLGFPGDPRSDEQSPVFEFSVGSLGI